MNPKTPCWQHATWRQFGAAIDTLRNAMEACPDALWTKDCPSRPFWYWVYHCIFFLDFYLADSDEGFTPPSPFRTSELDPEGRFPDRTYTKEELLDYLAHCRRKCRAKIEGLTEETAQQHCGFQRRDFTVAELLLYNLRHVQHHAAQLHLILRQELDAAPHWVSKASQ